jgi:sugar phosphate isomerase/epimerase
VGKWKYGVSAALDAPKTAPILLTGDICDCLREAAELGFQAIEYHTRENAALDTAKIRNTMERTGCQISMLVTGRLYTQGHYSLTHNDPENRRAALEGMLRYINLAAELSCGVVLGWAKGNIREADSLRAYFERLTDGLRVLDQAAAERHVPIMIEVINHYEVDVFKTSRELCEYLKRHKFQNCLVHLDTFHMLLEEETFVEAIQTAAGRLGYVHLADTTRWYPGSGYMDYKPVLRALNDVGYKGYLTIECFPRENAKECARKGLRYLKTLEETLF